MIPFGCGEETESNNPEAPRQLCTFANASTADGLNALILREVYEPLENFELKSQESGKMFMK